MKSSTHYILFFCVRLAVLVCTLTCILLFTLSYFIERSFEKYAVEQNIVELNAVVNTLQTELFIHPPVDKHYLDQFEQSIIPILASHHHLYVYIENRDGTVLYKTRGPNLLLAKSLDEFTSSRDNRQTAVWDYDDSTYRVTVVNFTLPDHNQYTIIAAIGREQQQQYVSKLHEGLTIIIIITCVISFVWTMTAIYFTQKPIELLTKRIESLTSKQLSYRIPLSIVPAKFVGIVNAFNDMFARMEDVFHRQRNFTADIAHEIRTPITNLVTQTQIALSNARTTEEYREILYSNLEEYERLSKMISDMLFLAQTDNKLLTPELVNIDLFELFTQIFDYYEPLIEDKNIDFSLRGHVPEIQGDRLMLSRAIGNLISNAIRYTPSGQSILVKLSQYNRHYIQFSVANPGKKIQDKHLPNLFDRFYRVDKSRQRNGEGSGIGLAIVKSIIETLKGTIYVESDDVSTRFVVILPISNQNAPALEERSSVSTTASV